MNIPHNADNSCIFETERTGANLIFIAGQGSAQKLYYADLFTLSATSEYIAARFAKRSTALQAETFQLDLSEYDAPAVFNFLKYHYYGRWTPEVRYDTEFERLVEQMIKLGGFLLHKTFLDFVIMEYLKHLHLARMYEIVDTYRLDLLCESSFLTLEDRKLNGRHAETRLLEFFMETKDRRYRQLFQAYVRRVMRKRIKYLNRQNLSDNEFARKLHKLCMLMISDMYKPLSVEVYGEIGNECTDCETEIEGMSFRTNREDNRYCINCFIDNLMSIEINVFS
jgi:hypothetical protein